MDREFRRWIYIGAFLTFLISIPLHFLYDFIGGTPMWAGYFLPVNESVWEHLKLLFYPGIIVGVIEYFLVGKNYANFIFAKTMGIFLGMCAIVASFYTYSGVLGENFLIADILTYVIGAIVMALVTIKIVEKGIASDIKYRRLAIILIVFMGIIFAVYTYNPPGLDIFKDFQEGGLSLICSKSGQSVIV